MPTVDVLAHSEASVLASVQCITSPSASLLYWMKMDLSYIDNWSLWLDFKILFQTVKVVLLGEGR